METTIKPAAQKERGAEWYRPVVKVERGIRCRILRTDRVRCESRSKAMTYAKQYIAENKAEILETFDADLIHRH